MIILGSMLIAGGLKGLLDDLFRPTRRRIEHTPVYVKQQ